MPFGIGEKVGVNRGGPNLTYGEVIRKVGTTYTLRLGGSDSTFVAQEAEMSPIIPDRTVVNREAAQQAFWNEVRAATQTDKPHIKHISVSTEGFTYRTAGIRYFRSIALGDGKYRLEARDARSDEYCTAVYWLPYAGSRVTSVNRAQYERNEAVEYFMTLELSGCRFTLTDQATYHVAFDAGTTAQDPTAMPGKRDEAESRKMREVGDPATRPRRLSLTGDDRISYGYGFFDNEKCRATVIGHRKSAGQGRQEWVYKAFLYHSQGNLGPQAAFVQVLDNTKYAGDSLWAKEFQ